MMGAGAASTRFSLVVVAAMLAAGSSGAETASAPVLEERARVDVVVD